MNVFKRQSLLLSCVAMGHELVHALPAVTKKYMQRIKKSHVTALQVATDVRQ